MMTSEQEDKAQEQEEREIAAKYVIYKNTIDSLMANKEKIFVVIDKNEKAEVKTLDECIKNNVYSIFSGVSIWYTKKPMFFYDKKDAEYNAKLLNYFYILKNAIEPIQKEFDCIEEKVEEDTFFNDEVKNEKGETEYITRISGKKKDIERYENVYNRYYGYFISVKDEIYNILNLLKDGICFGFPIYFLHNKEALNRAEKYYNEYLR